MKKAGRKRKAVSAKQRPENRRRVHLRGPLVLPGEMKGICKAKRKLKVKRKVPEPGLIMKYFILKPSGTNLHAIASRLAMMQYADVIQMINKKMAAELRAWVRKECQKAAKV